MRAIAVIVLSLAAVAVAGPAISSSNNNNQIYSKQQYMTTSGDQTEAVAALQQWCFSSQLSQTELTGAFKKLVNIVKSDPKCTMTESAVMNERICQGAIVAKSAKTGETLSQTGADAQAQDLIKDVYMDALIACDSTECLEQLMKIVDSNKVDPIRSSYYMTRLAVAETAEQESNFEALVKSFIAADYYKNTNKQSGSEAVERQKMFAVTSIVGKMIESGKKSVEHLKQAEQVIKVIIERYIKSVTKEEVAKYKAGEQSSELVKKIAHRNAALKALTNIPGWMLKKVGESAQEIMKIAEDKDEQSTARQSAIEILTTYQAANQILKKITFDQEEPIEVRVAAYRTLMANHGFECTDKATNMAEVEQMVQEMIQYVENSRNQQEDKQFVVYVVSHLNNLRTSQPTGEHENIVKVIRSNKQSNMQIQLLEKKFKKQLEDVRKWSRNYKLEQTFNQLESGLIIEGDVVYGESKQEILPKVVRFNMSMPVMGETVNVFEISVRQNEMDEEILKALSVGKNSKFVGQFIDSFKTKNLKQQLQTGNEEAAEADLCIKVDGYAMIYVSADDFKAEYSQQFYGKTRQTRSVHQQQQSGFGELVEDFIEYLKREPVAFNRGFNLNIQERLAKLLDIEANVIAGLRFESRAQGTSSDNFELSAQIEPRFAFEAITGPAKVSSKKLLQRLSTKTAFGLRLRYKQNELVDVQLDLPMNDMDLFTIESQIVESSQTGSYSYLANSIYGPEDIYAIDELMRQQHDQSNYNTYGSIRKQIKRSVFESTGSNKSAWNKVQKMMQGKQSQFAHEIETPVEIERATGLRGKLRVVASPKDMSYFVQASAQKVESSMQGYRVQVQRATRGQDQEQYIVTVSTPGSRTDRTMQVRVVAQSSQVRTLLKSELQSPFVGAQMQLELVHDARLGQYSTKLEMSSIRGKPWRHQLECGLSRGQQSQAGRLVATFKPYLSVQSSELRRPIQLAGQVSFQQQSPKSVISFDLKSLKSADFVQGKLAFEQRSVSNYNRRQRSMQSPIVALVFGSDFSMNLETVGQIDEQAFKSHQVIDWTVSQMSVAGDMKLVHKCLKSGQEQQLVSAVKIAPEQQMVSVERRTPGGRSDFRFNINSQFDEQQQQQQPIQHQLIGELRTSTNKQPIVYKHKLTFGQIGSKKIQVGGQFELSAEQLQNKLQGRVELSAEPKMKAFRGQLSAGPMEAQLKADYASIGEHQISLNYQDQKYQHQCAVRATKPGQLKIESTTTKVGQLVQKLQLEVSKPDEQVVFVFELPTERTHIAADLKLRSGDSSSLAVASPRFTGKTEFAYNTLKSASHLKHLPSWMRPVLAKQYRLKGDLKDQIKQEAYWMDSAWNEAGQPSYFRFESPAMRSDLDYVDQTYRMSAFGRNKRSVGYPSTFDNSNTYLNEAFSTSNDEWPLNKMELGNKLWMIRSMISPMLKEQARRALFEYADRRQQHKHQLDWSPRDQRVSFNLDASPATTAGTGSSSYLPMRLQADLNTKIYGNQRPSSLSLSSQWADLDVTAQPYDGESAFARISALSRSRRSTFSKHDSELTYSKKHGYKGSVEHQDSDSKRHSVQFEAEPELHKHAKLNYDSDCYGKGQYEHQWRKHQKTTKRGHQAYDNKLSWDSQSPSGHHQSHKLAWTEPIDAAMGRVRRSTSDRYSLVDYLKRSQARLQSQMNKSEQPIYKLDLDYEPEEKRAALELAMADQMLHQSTFDYEPNQRTYKLVSRLVDQRSQQPAYQLLAQAKQARLGDQQTYGQIVADSTWKLNYNDKFGRRADFDYDQSPLMSRQKRASIYYKDGQTDFEHQSSFDFEPEQIFGRDQRRNSAIVTDDNTVVFKSQTKYGPVKLELVNEHQIMQLELESPLVDAKLVSQEAAGRSGAQLIKLIVSNKNQKVSAVKVARKLQLLDQFELVHQIAKSLDAGRFEHDTELLVSFVQSVLKLNSQTYYKQRPVFTVQGEFNKQQDKAFFKIEGARVEGQCVVDLSAKSAQLVFNVDEKRTMQHFTRLTRVSDKFYALESATSYKQKPLAKISAKISSMIFEEPEHLFSSRRTGLNTENHASTFEATIYQPQPYIVNGIYDCKNKEARIVFKNVQDKKIQETRISYDDEADCIRVDARLNSTHGNIYTAKADLSLASVFNPSSCNETSCKSQAKYETASGVYSTYFNPKGPSVFNTPYGSRGINFAEAY